MDHTPQPSSDWLAGVRREFAANEVVRRKFRAALDRRDAGWAVAEHWPHVLLARPLPRTIWMYWDQGWNHAPEIVRRCRESWVRHNPAWDVRALDRDSVEDVARVAHVVAGKTVGVQAFTDIVRLSLLDEHGGVWADANTVCTKPLDDWLAVLMQSGFFAFAKPRPGRLVSTWFLASEPHGSIISRWSALARRYWSEVTQADVYLWCHYLFSYACHTDDVFAAGWAATPHVSGYGPLQAQLLKFGVDVERDALASIAAGAVPVFKLTHGAETPAAADGSALASMIRALLAPYAPPTT
jgi:hypothetical protein